jgi:hypothetical protein
MSSQRKLGDLFFPEGLVIIIITLLFSLFLTIIEEKKDAKSET